MASKRSTLTSIEPDGFPVLLRIRSEQLLDGDAEPSLTEQTADGVLYVTPDGIQIVYKESGDMAGTSTTLNIQKEQLVLTRRGAVQSRMVFAPEQPHTSLYQTPFGAIQTHLETTALQHNITAQGGLLSMRYRMTLDHRISSQNQCRILVRTQSRIKE